MMVDFSQAPEMGRFNGENPLDWILQAERYFHYYSVSDAIKLPFVSVFLDGDAREWFRWLYCNNQFENWENFVLKLFRRFSNDFMFTMYESSSRIFHHLDDIKETLSACSRKCTTTQELSNMDSSLEDQCDSNFPMPVSLPTLVDSVSQHSIETAALVFDEFPHQCFYSQEFTDEQSVAATLPLAMETHMEDENSGHEDQLFPKSSQPTEIWLLKPMIQKELSLASYHACKVYLVASDSSNSHNFAVTSLPGLHAWRYGDCTTVVLDDYDIRLDMKSAHQVLAKLSARETFEEIWAPNCISLWCGHALALDFWVDTGQKEITLTPWAFEGHINTQFVGMDPAISVVDRSSLAKASSKSVLADALLIMHCKDPQTKARSGIALTLDSARCAILGMDFSSIFTKFYPRMHDLTGVNSKKGAANKAYKKKNADALTISNLMRFSGLDEAIVLVGGTRNIAAIHNELFFHLKVGDFSIFIDSMILEDFLDSILSGLLYVHALTVTGCKECMASSYLIKVWDPGRKWCAHCCILKYNFVLTFLSSNQLEMSNKERTKKYSGAGILALEAHTDKMDGESNSAGLAVHFQATFCPVIPRVIREEQIHLMMKILLPVFLFQLVPKISHSLSSVRKVQNLRGYIFVIIFWELRVSCFNLVVQNERHKSVELPIACTTLAMRFTSHKDGTLGAYTGFLTTTELVYLHVETSYQGDVRKFVLNECLNKLLSALLLPPSNVVVCLKECLPGVSLLLLYHLDSVYSYSNGHSSDDTFAWVAVTGFVRAGGSFNNYISQGRTNFGSSDGGLFLASNLEDKVLIDEGRNVMNCLTGLRGGLCFNLRWSPSTKQSNKRLIWDPGPINKWLNRN